MREPTKQTTFGDNDKRAMFEPGIYNAHINKLDSKEFDDGNEVFNLTFKLAPDGLKDIEIPFQTFSEGVITPVLDEDGEIRMIDASRFAGREFQLPNGAWFYESTRYDWQTNEGYANVCNAIGVDFPEKKVKGVMVRVLSKIDGEDVIGKPVKVKVGLSKWKNKSTGDSGVKLAILEVLPWPEGEALSFEEAGEADPF